MQKFMLVIMAFFVFFGVVSADAKDARLRSPSLKWAVYYGSDPAIFKKLKYNMIIVESGHAKYSAGAAFNKVRTNKQIRIAYISLGEVAKSGEMRDELVNRKLTKWDSKITTKWDSTVVKIKEPEWKYFFVNIMAKKLISRGYDGFLIDTTDTVIKNGNSIVEENLNAAINIINALRKAYPGKIIIVNGLESGYEIVKRDANLIDAVMSESQVSESVFISVSIMYVNGQFSP